MPSGMVSAQRPNPSAAVDDPQIELIGVRKEFGDSAHARSKIGRGHKVVAVEGADLTVGDGELFAILGPSGSGKTTVLRMIAGFEQPTAGVIRLGGVDVTALPARRRDVNTVFQEYALFPHMTVAQNVEYGLKVKGVPRDERRRRTSDALDMVRLSGEASRKPAQLSGGQRQRVALARALVGRPRRAAARRAARRTGSQAARTDADRTEGNPARSRHHVRHRHPRSRRGTHALRPARGLQRRPH